MTDPSKKIDRGHVTRLLKQLVSIDSVNPEMDGSSEGEYEISEFLKDTSRTLGLRVETQPVKTKGRRSIRRQNTIAQLRGRSRRKARSAKTLMFNCHMDTVPATGMTVKPFTPMVRNGFLYGRGSSDMKSGIASCVSAAKSILDSEIEIDGDVLLAFVVGEEYLSMGTETLVKKYGADAAIVGEPTNLNLGLAHKGFAWLEVEVFGRSAHGSVPEVGVDAIEKMSEVVQGISSCLRSDLLKKSRSHPLVGSPKVHPSQIEGGRAWNIIPDYCKLRVERRTVPGESADLAINEIRSICEKVKRDSRGDFSFKVNESFSRHPLETSEDEPIVGSVRSAYRRTLRREAKVTGMPFWTDAAYLSKPGGIPSVVIGPGIIEEAHTAGEKVELSQVYDAAELYRETILRFFASND